MPLRFTGALHRLVLDGAEPALAAAYPPHALDTDALTGAPAQVMLTEGSADASPTASEGDADAASDRTSTPST